MSEQSLPISQRGFGLPWLLLCAVLALRVWDEAADDFLSCYNSTVLTLCFRFAWFSRMDKTYSARLVGLIVAITV